MIFFYNDKEYSATTATEIVIQMAREPGSGFLGSETLKDYVFRSLTALSDRIPMRELGVSSHLSDEAIAFNYLCLLDEYDDGSLDASPESPTFKDR